VKRDTDEEFVTHAALVEHLRQFRQEGVVFFHPPSGEERTKRVHPKTGKLYCPGGTGGQVRRPAEKDPKF
jgi:hypothetical protein